jgi:hypothetical protein
MARAMAWPWYGKVYLSRWRRCYLVILGVVGLFSLAALLAMWVLMLVYWAKMDLNGEWWPFKKETLLQHPQLTKTTSHFLSVFLWYK